jgi:hypothetical protein
MVHCRTPLYLVIIKWLSISAYQIEQLYKAKWAGMPTGSKTGIKGIKFGKNRKKATKTASCGINRQ